MVRLIRTPLGVTVFALITALFGLGWFWMGSRVLQQQTEFHSSFVLAYLALTLSAICMAVAVGLACKALWAHRAILWLAPSCILVGALIASIITFFLIDHRHTLSPSAILAGFSVGGIAIALPICYLAYFSRERVGQHFKE